VHTSSACRHAARSPLSNLLTSRQRAHSNNHLTLQRKIVHYASFFALRRSERDVAWKPALIGATDLLDPQLSHCAGASKRKQNETTAQKMANLEKIQTRHRVSRQRGLGILAHVTRHVLI
jgi:hypothetical protein